MMLNSTEFTVGTFASAAIGSLILPRGQYEAAAIIGASKDIAAAIYLNEEYKFTCRETAGNENMSDLIIPNVRFEVDQTSCFDPEYGSVLGAIIRKGADLGFNCKRDGDYGSRTFITVESNLPRIASGSVAFTRWQIVVGDAIEKRTLFKFEAEPTKR